MISECKHMCIGVQQRWVFTIVAFFGVMNTYTMRNCLSLAIVAMVDPTDSNSNETSSKEIANTTTVRVNYYHWDEYTQGLILSSFYWGYIVTQIPGGMLAEKFGGKYVLGMVNLLTSILTLLTPIIVQYYDLTGLIVSRFILGLVGGPIFPTVNFLIAKWSPPKERSSISTIVMTGSVIGTVIGTALSGVLIKYSDIGWPSVFYLFGSCGFVWCVVWIILCSSTPGDHPFISAKEKKYLHDVLSEHMHEKSLQIPWRHLLMSTPLWALIIAAMGAEWAWYTILSDLPKYMKSVMGFSIEANGFLSALPHLCSWFTGIAASFLVDWIITSNKLSRTRTRKLFSFLSAVTTGILMVTACYVTNNRTIVVLLLTLGVSMMSLNAPTIGVNSLDLSPNFCGTLMGIINGFGCLSGILAPYAVGVIVPNQTASEWKLVFWIVAVIIIGTNLTFVVWGDGEVQNWNEPGFAQNRTKKSENDITMVKSISTEE